MARPRVSFACLQGFFACIYVFLMRRVSHMHDSCLVYERIECKRDLYTCKRDVHTGQRDLFDWVASHICMSRVSCRNESKPNESNAKETCIRVKETCIQAKKSPWTRHEHVESRMYRIHMSLLFIYRSLLHVYRSLLHLPSQKPDAAEPKGPEFDLWLGLGWFSSSAALQHTDTHRNALQRTVTHCNTLTRTAMHCNALLRAATRCSALQRTWIHWSTLRHDWGVVWGGSARVPNTHVPYLHTAYTMHV